MTIGQLPKNFKDLQHLTEHWALTCEEDRFNRLHSVSHQELSDFYHEMLPKMPVILEHLSNCKLSALSNEDLTLYNLACTMAETSHPMDLEWGATDFPGAYSWRAFQFATISQSSRAKPAS